MQALDYDRNINNNLSCDCFTAIVPGEASQLKGKKLAVNLKERRLKTVGVMATVSKSLDEMTDFDTLPSMGLTAMQFRAKYLMLKPEGTQDAFTILLVRTI